MELTDTLKKQLRRTRQAGASRTEREAVIDLLVMTMYADRFIDTAENEAIERVAFEIDSNANLPLGQYLSASIAKVRKALDSKDEERTLLQDVSKRLGSDRMRALATDASRAVARADGTIAKQEEQFLRSVEEVFEFAP